jgi:heterodisulfide reductase subunit B
MPVFYITQLVGLAAGLKADKLGLDALIVNPMPLLKEKGLLWHVKNRRIHLPLR